MHLFNTGGLNAFKNQNYTEAVDLFTQAIQCESTPNHAIVYANRSSAFYNLSNYKKAFKDAVKCIQLKPNWPKGYLKKANALNGL